MRSSSSIFGYRPEYFAYAMMFLVSLAGCARLASSDRHTALPPPEQACLAEFTLHDLAVSKSGVNDVQFARIPGYPYLRINRLLRTFHHKLDSREKQLAWLRRLATLDINARSLENNNLPVERRENLAGLNNCRNKLVAHLANSSSDFEKLLAMSTVADSYSTGKRLAGLYPLARWPVFNGVLKLQNRENPSQTIQRTQSTQLYSSRLTTQPLKFLNHSSRSPDTLGFPRLTNRYLEGLRNTYAPVWAIETQNESDVPGALIWSPNEVAVETNSPSEYGHYSYAVFENKLVLQLMYTIWLPAVPATRTVDIYAGKIDGLTFRVTLDHDFEPLLVDVMHNCGCYYMAFPSSRLAPKAITNKYDEPLWTPFELPILNPGERFMVQLRAGNHFVMGLSTGSDLGQIKQLTPLPYDKLRSLTVSTGENRSVFSPRGLIENSQRLERFILWPMGVLSAGAMRQSGHHAIAFVGRRHFDDPQMINDYFARR